MLFVCMCNFCETLINNRTSGRQQDRIFNRNVEKLFVRAGTRIQLDTPTPLGSNRDSHPVWHSKSFSTNTPRTGQTGYRIELEHLCVKLTRSCSNLCNRTKLKTLILYWQNKHNLSLRDWFWDNNKLISLHKRNFCNRPSALLQLPSPKNLRT